MRRKRTLEELLDPERTPDDELISTGEMATLAGRVHGTVRIWMMEGLVPAASVRGGMRKKQTFYAAGVGRRLRVLLEAGETLEAGWWEK